MDARYAEHAAGLLHLSLLLALPLLPLRLRWVGRGEGRPRRRGCSKYTCGGRRET